LRGFLLDTNVISIMAPSQARASKKFLEWLERMDGDNRIFLSVVTIHEIERGIALLEYRGAQAKASELKLWLTGLVATYTDKIIGIDATAAMIAGRLEAMAVSAGYQPGMADAAIAGIAKAHDLHIVTSNMKHFLPFNVSVSSPADAIALE